MAVTKNLQRAVAMLAVLAGTVLWQPASPAAQTAPFDAGVEIRAQLKPVRQAVLAAGMAGVVEGLPKREGERFREGETLVSIDCAVQRAQRAKTLAEREAARRVLAVNERLAKLDATSEIEVELARAEVAKSEADVRVMQATVRKCTVEAPFAGRVVEHRINRHQYVKEGEPLLEILDDRALELELIVPSEWLLWLKVGSPFTVHLLETGRDYAAEVASLGARIDAVSQTLRITGRIGGEAADLLPGMSGRAVFPEAR